MHPGGVGWGRAVDSFRLGGLRARRGPKACPTGLMSLGEDLFYDLAVHFGQALFAALMEITELVLIQSHLV